MKRRPVLLTCVWLVFLLSLACNYPTGIPEATGAPFATSIVEAPFIVEATSTLEATSTYTATATPWPTYTPKPVNTPVPAHTARPTAPPNPVATLPAATVPTALAPAVATALATAQLDALPGLPGAASAEVVGMTLLATRRAMEEFGGMIDIALGQGWVDCEEVVLRFDTLAAAPSLTVAAGDAAAVEGHALYRQAIGVFTAGAKDMTQNCRDLIANQGAGDIPFQQWGLARLRVNEAIELLNAGWARVQ